MAVDTTPKAGDTRKDLLWKLAWQIIQNGNGGTPVGQEPKRSDSERQLWKIILENTRANGV